MTIIGIWIIWNSRLVEWNEFWNVLEMLQRWMDRSVSIFIRPSTFTVQTIRFHRPRGASRTTLGRLWIWLLNERILTDEDCRVRRWCKVVGQLHLPIVYTSTGEGKHSRTVYSSSWLQKMFFQTFTWFPICSCPSLTFLRSERSEGPGLTFFFFSRSAGIGWNPSIPYVHWQSANHQPSEIISSLFGRSFFLFFADQIGCRFRSNYLICFLLFFNCKYTIR